MEAVINYHSRFPRQSLRGGANMIAHEPANSPRALIDLQAYGAGTNAITKALLWYSQNGKTALTFRHFQDLFRFVSQAFHPLLLDQFPRQFVQIAYTRKLRIQGIQRIERAALRSRVHELEHMMSTDLGRPVSLGVQELEVDPLRILAARIRYRRKPKLRTRVRKLAKKPRPK